MLTFVYMTRCDGCGERVHICSSDIVHNDRTYCRAYSIEPNFCWECYSCVKACPQHAIDLRGYADLAPLGRRVRVLEDEDKNMGCWKIRYRDGRLKESRFRSGPRPAAPSRRHPINWHPTPPHWILRCWSTSPRRAS